MTRHHHLFSTTRRPDSGNALWFVLLAIALLVALTVVITRSSENTEETGARDRSRILASDILRQAKGMEQAINTMRMQGIGENDISFDTPELTGYGNTNCGDSSLNTDDDPCKIFHRDGGGLSYKKPGTEWLDSSRSTETTPQYGEWYFHAISCVPGVGTGGSGCLSNASETELFVILPWIKQDICTEINRLTGVPNLSSPARPPTIDGTAWDASATKFTGTFSTDSEVNTASDSFKSHPTGCFAGDTSDPNGGYHFYHVLIPR